MIAIGNTIQRRRLELNFTQSDLADGICSSATLSRIEAGTQEPSYHVFEAIMQRLGFSRSRYSIFASEKDLEIYNLMYDIDCELAAKDFVKTERLFKELESKVSPKAPTHWQYVLYIKALLLWETKDYQTTLVELEKALAVTNPSFFSTHVTRLLLTLTEVDILRNMANCFHKLSDSTKAIEMSQKLIDYLETRFVDPFEMASTLIGLYSNISKFKGLSGDAAGALKDSDTGIALCKRYGRLHGLPHLLFSNGYAHYYMNKNMPIAVSIMRQAYSLFTILEDKTNMKIIENLFTQENLALVPNGQVLEAHHQ